MRAWQTRPPTLSHAEVGYIRLRPLRNVRTRVNPSSAGRGKRDCCARASGSPRRSASAPCMLEFSRHEGSFPRVEAAPDFRHLPPHPHGGPGQSPPATGERGVAPAQKCEGVERRAAHPLASRLTDLPAQPAQACLRRGAPDCDAGVSPSGAPPCGFSVPGAVASGRDKRGSPGAFLIRRASARLRSRRVQPIQGQPVVMPADGWPGPPDPADA
jgi:hypothetical protein